MTTDWMLDVLADLKAFANANGMAQLEQQLEVTADVAAQEGASRADSASGKTREGLVTDAGRFYRSP